ncbi:hypothetical protein [Flavobacterium sp. ASW18X]|uniref:hypothetical protein n=1 Tax=Flavobacterium sp. ASW18X TaxID=2572595 RepID=UPI0010AE662F|nr:hypothetical protein [Flavobacterium sp. ASW18X]TKD59160.1 hypothetical protein FBT53_13565 [Flavobacterium sp. ASW18X]
MTAAHPSFNFANDTNADTGIYRPAADELAIITGGYEALRADEYSTGNTQIIVQNRLAVGKSTTDNTGYSGPNTHSTLEVSGSMATAITVTTGNITLDETHHTIILGGAHNVTLPDASTCTGRMYVIKNTIALTASISTYEDLLGVSVTLIPYQGVIWIQSDGTKWQLINKL